MIIRGFNNKEIFVREWLPKQTKAIIVIVHGFKDHSNRYSCLGEWFMEQGVAVYGIDLRGQGMTGGSGDGYGLLEQPDGWMLMRQDLDILINKIGNEHPDTKIFLLGHSMGSMLVRDYLLHNGNKLSGIILSGTTQQPVFMMYAGAVITKLLALIKSPIHKSPFLEKMIYGPYQKSVKHRKHRRDWLSRDEKRVEWIVEDAYSQGRLSVEYYLQFFKAVIRIFSEERELGSKNKIRIRNVSNDVPILIYCGDSDPVGAFGKHPKKLFHEYEKAGHCQVTLKIYPGARHELHNETNRNEVFEDILGWMKPFQ